MDAKQAFLTTRLNQLTGNDLSYCILQTQNKIRESVAFKRYDLYYKVENTNFSSEDLSFFVQYFEFLGYNVYWNKTEQFIHINWKLEDF